MVYMCGDDRMEDQEITRGKVVLAGGWVGWGVESWKQQKQLQMQMVMGVMCRMHMNGLWHTRVYMDRRTRMNTLWIHMSVLFFWSPWRRYRSRCRCRRWWVWCVVECIWMSHGTCAYVYMDRCTHEYFFEFIYMYIYICIYIYIGRTHMSTVWYMRGWVMAQVRLSHGPCM